MKRKGFSQDERNLIKEAYKLLFHSNLNTTQALEEIEKTMRNCKFISYTKNTITSNGLPSVS
jgi:acyl-[acyl carrier protein]--UDP-N-acetylglucosamine O-acyltransferase